MFDYTLFTDTLIKGDKENITTLLKEAVDGGEDAKTVLDEGMIAGMNVVGDRMEKGEMFIPEVLMAAQVMSIGLEYLKPLLKEGDDNAAGKVVIGTVKGDLHDIGKNLVAIMCEGSGLEVINLGVDISPDQFVAAVEENEADILCLSALLTTTMPEMEKTVEAVRASSATEDVRIMVGGAPVTQAFADKIGAHAYKADAGAAAKRANELMDELSVATA